MNFEFGSVNIVNYYEKRRVNLQVNKAGVFHCIYADK